MEKDLFADSKLADFLNERLSEFKTKVTESNLDSLIFEYKIDPIVLDVENAVNLPCEEAMLPTRENHYSAGDDRRNGSKLSKKYARRIPFSGAPELFNMMPNGWCSGRPMGDVDVENKTVTVSVYDQKGMLEEQMRKDLDIRVLGLNPFLQKSIKDINEFNAKLVLD